MLPTSLQLSQSHRLHGLLKLISARNVLVCQSERGDEIRFSLRRPEAWIDRAKQWPHPKIIASLVVVPFLPAPKCCPLSNSRHKERQKRNRGAWTGSEVPGCSVSTFISNAFFIYFLSVIFHIINATIQQIEFSYLSKRHKDYLVMLEILKLRLHFSRGAEAKPMVNEWTYRIDFMPNREERRK